MSPDCTEQTPGTPAAPPLLHRMSLDLTSVTGLLLLCARIHESFCFPLMKRLLKTACADTPLKKQKTVNNLMVAIQTQRKQIEDVTPSELEDMSLGVTETSYSMVIIKLPMFQGLQYRSSTCHLSYRDLPCLGVAFILT